MGRLIFANPEYFYLLFLLLPLIGWYLLKQKEARPSVKISSFRGFKGISKSYKVYLRHLPFVLRMLALVALIFVLARPQSTNSWQKVDREGIDIIMAVDISGSMLAEDLKPNRLEAAIDVASRFIAGRPDDNIGLVVFGGEAFTQCPLTTDHAVLANLFQDINAIQLEEGTAIGMGLATAVSRLKKSTAKSKVIILLTDGRSNRGEIAPETAMDLAKTFGIRVYTVGVGTNGMAPIPIQTNFGVQYRTMEVDIDEDLLKRIAQTTDAEYFRATDNDKLKAIYAEIDQLERTKIDVKEFSKKKEEYFRFALLVAFFLLSDIVLRNTLLRTIP